jgi:hypothetical protein
MNKYKYPSNQTLLEGISQLKEQKVRTKMPEEVIKACHTLAAHFYAAIPYYDLYELYCKSPIASLTEEDLRKAYGEEWDRMPAQLKNKVWSIVEKVEQQWNNSLTTLGEFINRQAHHAADLADEQIEELETLADQLAA